MRSKSELLQTLAAASSVESAANGVRSSVLKWRAGRDWNFETMQAPTGQQPSFVTLPGNADHELYEYPGRFLDSQGGETMMRNRIQATETDFETVEAQSSVRTRAPGQTFTPQDVANPDNSFAAQVVTAIRHRIVNPSYEAAGG